MNPTILMYFLIVALLLTNVFLYLKRFRHQAFAFILSTVVYGLVAMYAAAITAHDGFMVFQLLSYGCFIGGTMLLAMSSILASKNFKLLSGLYALTTLAVVGIGIDAFFIEPRLLEIKRHSIISNKLNEPVHIAILSDLQTDNIGDFERHVMKVVAEDKPDLFLLPGDYLQTFTQAEWDTECEKFRKLFSELHIAPKFGTFAVQGNVDHYPGWQRLFTDIPGHVFENSQTVSAGAIDITGLSFLDGQNSKINIPKTEKFHIAMAHYPDYAMGDVNADLLVAGHCHGGQVQVPFFGPIITFSHVPKTWVNGQLVKLSGDRNLIVSRGVGMERHNAPRLRFWCRPQLIFVDLLPEKIKPQAKSMMSPVVSSWDQQSELSGASF